MTLAGKGSANALVKLAYAAPAFALAVVGIPVYIYIPKFYTDVVGVPMAALGAMISAVRLFDAVTDPVVGYLSDRTHSPYGRRRPYIAAGALLLAACLFFLFNPPTASPRFETGWFGFWVFALFLSWTMVQIPYEALGPEITFDYDERTTLFSIRDGALILGTLVAAASPALVERILGMEAGPAMERRKFFWIAVVYGPLLVGLSWLCTLVIREKPSHSRDAVSHVSAGLFCGLKQAAGNRPFVVLIVSYTVAAFGSNLPATLILYYVEYVLRSEDADLFLLLYFTVGIVFLPFWVKASAKMGKKRAWILSMLVNTGAFTGVFFLGPGDAWIYGILVFFSGIGFGATLALPSAMQADVIDYDELVSGERREGRYIGLWSIAKKLAAALGVGVALAVLGVAGYVPGSDQTGEVVMTLRVLYALVPSLCNVLAMIIVFAYPITKEVHEDILRGISERKGGNSVEDPLRSGRRIFPRGAQRPSCAQ
ncbi:MAG: MFS transporter [Deltaproteobacteria bacterium]|nr:MFS transporter [Deltaproteobacteria bacterium]